MSLKLNLGCGPDIKDGYVNIDVCPMSANVVKMDIRQLTYDAESVDEIYARDVIEHMPLQDTINALANWSNICKKGGKLFIQTVCWDSVLKAYHADVWKMEVLNYMLFAGKNWVDGISRPEDFHKSTYNVQYLMQLIQSVGFKVDKIELDSIDEALFRNPISHNLNMRFYATKL
jgi:predicted SAM-dependent methyltransferase